MPPWGIVGRIPNHRAPHLEGGTGAGAAAGVEGLRDAGTGVPHSGQAEPGAWARRMGETDH